MANANQTERSSQPLEIHLLGLDIAHSLSPPVHNYVAQSLNLPWRFYGTECQTIEDCLSVIKSPSFAGAVVTMPWKGKIIKYLDSVSAEAEMLNAVNVVYFGPDGKLCGSNVDWIGIEGALTTANTIQQCQEDETALIIGAGGAARAALYTLLRRFGARQIYILNRDEEEVNQLKRDCDLMLRAFSTSLRHVKSIECVNGLKTPRIIIGTVPDFAPQTPEEQAVEGMLSSFLARDGDKGVMLDMCYRPYWTRHMRLAREHGWKTVSGLDVVGCQVKALWKLWLGEEQVKKVDSEGMWRCLREAADQSPLINP